MAHICRKAIFKYVLAGQAGGDVISGAEDKLRIMQLFGSGINEYDIAFLPDKRDMAEERKMDKLQSVYYKHLTLPTICSV